MNIHRVKLVHQFLQEIRNFIRKYDLFIGQNTVGQRHQHRILGPLE